MKVLYVTPGIGGGGGAERSLASLVPHWRDEVQLHVVAFSERTHLSNQITAAGATLTNLGRSDFGTLVKQLKAQISLFKPDLVHSVLFDADVATRVAVPRNTPMSCSLVNVNYQSIHFQAPRRPRLKMYAAQAVDAMTAQRVTRFHALSGEVADVMARKLFVSRDKIDVIPRGRDRSEVGFNSPDRRAEVRKKLGIKDQPLIIAAARHEWQKGLDVLIEAFPKIASAQPDVRLLIGGPPGHETSHLRKMLLAANLDPDAILIGPRDDVPDLMTAADAFCVPSRWEGLGSILVEAMALGAQVVAADIAPIREIDNGIEWIEFFTPGSSDALAAAVLRRLADPRNNYRSQSARRLYESGYTSAKIAAEMAGFFQRAAS